MRTRKLYFFYGVAILYYVDPGSSQPFFSEVSQSAGINMPHSSVSEYYATGQAWGDYNNDGRLDLYLTVTRGANRLYENNGDGTFARSAVDEAVALNDDLSGGAVFADYNNDGWQDLYVLNWGANVLLRNDEGLGFTNVTEEAGVGDLGKGVTGAWGDYNGDGLLDLYVANWYCENCREPYDVAANRDRLYRNNGDGTFTDVSSFLGFENTDGAGFVGSFLDYDNDGDLDIYVVNDKFTNPIGNQLWRNDGPGCGGWCFTEVSKSAGANVVLYGMGLAIGDYDNDLDLDLYFSNIGSPVLLQNRTSQGNPSFVEAALTDGIQNHVVTWGTFFFDYDNDGWLDLYQGSGNVWNVLDSPNYLFHNLADGTFQEMTGTTGVNHPGKTLGAAYADYDNDGRLDFIIGNWDQGYRLFHNDGEEESNHWLAVKLTGGGAVNRDAIGSRVYVSLSDGRTLMQEVKCGSSHGSGNQLALHFGLGRKTVDSLKVVWPNANTVSFSSVAVNQVFEVTYSGQVTQVSDRSHGRLNFFLAPNFPNPFNPETTIRYRLAERGPVKIVIVDVLGRLVRTLVDGVRAAGEFTVHWDATNDAGARVATGVYVVRMETAGFAKSHKMLFLK